MVPMGSITQPMELQMTDIIGAQVAALAKAALFPLAYAAFFVWSYAILLQA
jgi:hypothetical protein